jgi:hypothetical protein
MKRAKTSCPLTTSKPLRDAANKQTDSTKGDFPKGVSRPCTMELLIAMRLFSGALLFLSSCVSVFAGERVEYEGELMGGSSNGTIREPAPLVRVVTEDNQVRKVTIRYRDSERESVEVFEFSETKPLKVIRHQELSPATGEVTATHDLTMPAATATLSETKRERIIGSGEVLIRHFYNKGGYRRVLPGEGKVLVFNRAPASVSTPQAGDNSAGRPFAQREQADLVLHAEPGRIWIDHPNPKGREALGVTELSKQVAAATGRRDMAVVILSKATSVLPPDKIKETADELEGILRGEGFKKVIFQFATGGTSIPIYRE